MSSLNLRKVPEWRGVWTAVVTPLSPRRELDDVSLEKLVEEQIAAGVRGLVIGGSTGEGSLLSPQVFENLLAAAHRFANGRIPLVAGLGIGGTDACLRNIELARKYQYSAVLASPPAYVKAPQRGLRDHYLRLADGGLPLCIYEIAGRAASSIELSTLVELAQSLKVTGQNLIAIKDASGNLQRALDQKRMLRLPSGSDRFALLSGDDGTFAPFVAAGGHGVISVVSHLVPRSMSFILRSIGEGKVEEAVQEQNRIAPLIEAIFWESNPVPIKSLLAAQGRIKDAVFCEPLCPMKKEQLEKLIEISKKTPDHGL